MKEFPRVLVRVGGGYGIVEVFSAEGGGGGKA